MSSSRFCPDPSWGPQTECGRNITRRHGCWSVQVTSFSAISHTDLLCSNQFAFDFGPISRPCLQLIPWLLTPDWVIIEALLWWTQTHPMAPSGVGLRLCYGSSSSSPSPVRIRSLLKKEAVWEEGRSMAAQCEWVEDKAIGRPKGQRRRLQSVGTIGGGGDFRNTNKKRWKGMRYWS